MTTKQKNEKEKQATRVLYLAVAAMLVVMAVIVMLSSMLSNVADDLNAIDTQSSAVTDAQTRPTAVEDQVTQPVADVLEPEEDEQTLPVIADKEEDNVPTHAPQGTVPTLSVPVDGILAHPFSDTTLVYSNTMEDYRTHMGIDVNASIGDKVYAAANGIIKDVWYDPMMGSCVRVEHEGGVECIYRNLAQDLCEGIGIGSSLLTGDAIGFVGESAMIELAQEPHLHFETKVNGEYVDPMSLMSKEAKATLMQQDIGYEG
ncbi:MAG: M23 family metallopeptidase [Oscillospiraceae bacterium]|nr:M23 family metallopeptidase [Oscillospiraceae bacterium]